MNCFWNEKETLVFYFISFMRWIRDKQRQSGKRQIKSEAISSRSRERKLAGTWCPAGLPGFSLPASLGAARSPWQLEQRLAWAMALKMPLCRRSTKHLLSLSVSTVRGTSDGGQAQHPASGSSKTGWIRLQKPKPSSSLGISRDLERKVWPAPCDRGH